MTKTKTNTRARQRPAPGLPEPFETRRIGDVEASLREAGEFFLGRGEVRRTLSHFAREADAAGIPYVVIGAMARNVHGHERMTTEIAVAVTSDARRRIHELAASSGFLPASAGSDSLRDTRNGVRIDLVLAGEFPGDGKAKPVAYPDPSREPLVVRDGVPYVTIEKLVELQLASGIGHSRRYKDIDDVVSLIGSARLPRDFGARLDPWVRAKWYELWDAWDADPRKDEF